MSTRSNGSFQAKYGNQIREETKNCSKSYTYYPVAIIGAGESGIATGYRLREELGFDQFRIFERQSGIGGSWWINRYPGAACSNVAIYDTNTLCSCIEKASIPPTASEILENLQEICQKHRILDKIQLNVEVRKCHWLESEQVWELTLWHIINKEGDLSESDRVKKVQNHGHESVYGSEQIIRAKVLVNTIGFIIEPNQLLEEVPGRKNFQGEIFHSLRWQYNVDLTDKEVIVVGTGCSATRFVPLLIDDYGAQSVTQLIRLPPWVVPLDTFSTHVNGSWNKLSLWLTRHLPSLGKLIRCCAAAGSDNSWRLFEPFGCSEKQRKNLEIDLLTQMKRVVPKKYHEILTPDHEFGCKPWVIDTAWLPSLKNPAVTLTTLPLTSIGETEVTLGPGRLYPDPHNTMSRAPNHKVTIPADVIILANEFDTNTWLYPLDVIGRSGKKLHDRFDEKRGSQMYMGIAHDGFPNFFNVLSPNTVNGNFSTILASENTLHFCLQLIKPLLEDEFSMVEVKQDAELRWARETQNALERMISKTGSSNSWYFDESGRGSVVYPYVYR
ncbi:Baeyer-Villiger monooxygenase [Erysiphe neolycopersici]|uniref:Baeyer-Villiger monooxygenase n=1 Tax=Erysiphe neolycopersici TaxID=212602 RepID=A0A420HW75_9PEZI|nr:Baeyer-Villiger monooxygenase [Erysiphe neolycopersici]